MKSKLWCSACDSRFEINVGDEFYKDGMRKVFCPICGIKVIAPQYHGDDVGRNLILEGMNRPEWGTFLNETMGTYVVCSCHQILQSIEAVREHWQSGHFDFPVYKSNLPT